jgi:RimJ/RimL family protein N-acetyltransferase
MELETPRLILRPFADHDAAALCAINADPKVMRYFPAPYSAAETHKMLEVWADKQTRFGYAFSAVEHKGDGRLLGMAGLSRLESGAPIAPCTEIGWRLTPAAWGQGYATEAALVWLAHGFAALGLPAVLSFAPRPNLASQKVMRRIGMDRASELDFDHPALPEDSPLRAMVVYQMLKGGFDEARR